MKANMEKRIAQKVLNMAMYTTKNSVGKSFPALAHEVKMPDSVRKEFFKKD